MSPRVLLPTVGLLGLWPGWSAAQVDLGQLWISPGFYSIHFDRNAGLKDQNPGIGLEWPLNPSVSLTGGMFHNSDRQTSRYLGVLWMPLAWKGMKFGAAMGGFDGYPQANDGGWFPAIIPTMAIEGQHWGLNIALIPEVKDRLHGAISFQLKFRFGGPPAPAEPVPVASGTSGATTASTASGVNDVSGGSGERP